MASTSAEYMREYRKANEAYKIRQRARSRARARALEALKEEYPTQFLVLYAACLEEEGLMADTED